MQRGFFFHQHREAELNLREVGDTGFDQLVTKGKEIWNRELGKIEVEDTNIDNLRTFYSCLYRSLLFPRSFYEIDAKGQVMHYSLITVRSCRAICLPIPVSGIRSVVFSPS